MAGGNGVYGYGASGTFPTNSYRALNYWVDVLFNAGPAPTLTSITVTPAGPSIAVGATQQLTATGTLLRREHAESDGQVAWSSASTSTATVSQPVLRPAVGGGNDDDFRDRRVGERQHLLTVQPAPLAITTTSLPGGDGGQQLHRYARRHRRHAAVHVVARRRQPAGRVHAHGSTGVISGTPTTTGTSSFTVPVTGGAQSTTKALGITVTRRHRRDLAIEPDTRVIDAGPERRSFWE